MAESAATATPKPARKRKPKAKPAAAPAAAATTDEKGAIAPELVGVAKGERTYLPAVPLSLIEEEPGFNPRTVIDDGDLEDLASSILLHGLNDPLQLRPKPGVSMGEGFYLTGGHRRWRACRMAGLKTVPAFVTDAGDALVRAALDNSLRVDLNPTEEARLFARLMAEKGLTAAGVAEVMSVARKRVTERLRILVLPPIAQTALTEGKLGSSHVGWLADLSEKHMGIATAVTQHMLETGRVPDAFGFNNHVVDKIEGVVGVRGIRAGSKHFALRKPEVKEAVDELASIRTTYQGPDYNWRTGDAARECVQVGYGEMVELTDQIIDEGLAVEAIIEVTTAGFREGDSVPVVIDLKWLQNTLDEAFPVALASLQAFRKRSRAGSKAAGDGGTATATAREQQEKAKKRAEREAKAKAREAALEANAKLGRVLMDQFASVELTKDVAIAVCAAPMHAYSQYGVANRDTVSGLAASGLRYLGYPEFAATYAARGKEVPALMSDREQLAKAFWTWWEKAKTPQEILGRTVIALLAVVYADRRAAMSREDVYAGWSIPDPAKKALMRIYSPKKAKASGAVTKATIRESGLDVGEPVKAAAKPVVDTLAEAGLEVELVDKLDDQQSAIELTDDERLVLVALQKSKISQKGRYGCSSESEVKSKLAEDTGLAARRCGGALTGLREKGIATGVKAAPYVNNAFEDLANALVVAAQTP